MKCPKCGRDMENGFLQSNGVTSPVIWVPKLRPLGFGAFSWDAQTVSYPIGAGTNALPACICRACKMIVADYSAKE